MAKIPFNDVTPPERRTIRNIPIPSSSRRKSPVVIKPLKEPEQGQASEPKNQYGTPFNSINVAKVPEPASTEKKDNGPYEYYYPKSKPAEFNGHNKSRKKQFLFAFLAVLAVGGFIIGMMTAFASASINIKPKSQAINVDTEITATNTLVDGAVKYEVLKLSTTKTATVAASGEEAAEVKASGKIVIYNNFSAEPQRLITRTRFESPEGLIFRISESVVVPGKTVKNGVETPGSIEVEVFADEAGEKYNIKKTDFTIPGFKNDATRYKNFYAKSSTNMTGGFIGKVKTVLPNDKKTALENISNEAKTELEKDLQTKVPGGLVLLPGAIVYESKETPQKEEGSSVILSEEVTAYALLLDNKSLTGDITKTYLAENADWSGINTAINDFSSLKLSEISGNPQAGEKLKFKVSGLATVSAEIDTEAVKEKLLGAPKKAAGSLIDEFAGISSVTATIRPVWKQSFPDNPVKIHVQVVTE